MHGMDSSYTKWVHHGDAFNVDVVEQPFQAHANADVAGSSYGENVREDGSADLAGSNYGENVREDGGADLAGSIYGEDVVREDDSVDHLEGLLGELHVVAEEARQNAENDDGHAQPHDKDSFLKKVMEKAKS
jgi:hypothetical protein